MTAGTHASHGRCAMGQGTALLGHTANGRVNNGVQTGFVVGATSTAGVTKTFLTTGARPFQKPGEVVDPGHDIRRAPVTMQFDAKDRTVPGIAPNRITVTRR